MAGQGFSPYPVELFSVDNLSIEHGLEVDVVDRRAPEPSESRCARAPLGIGAIHSAVGIHVHFASLPSLALLLLDVAKLGWGVEKLQQTIYRLDHPFGPLERLLCVLAGGPREHGQHPQPKVANSNQVRDPFRLLRR
jgi:hypothetical protein